MDWLAAGIESGWSLSRTHERCGCRSSTPSRRTSAASARQSPMRSAMRSTTTGQSLMQMGCRTTGGVRKTTRSSRTYVRRQKLSMTAGNLPPVSRSAGSRHSGRIFPISEVSPVLWRSLKRRRRTRTTTNSSAHLRKDGSSVRPGNERRVWPRLTSIAPAI